MVDNASNDGSVEYLKKQFGEELCCIVNEQNYGYAAGLNSGIRQAIGRDDDLILLLNNDTIVPKDFLVEFKSIADQNPSFDLFGPTILYNDQQEKIWFFGGKVIPGTMITYSLYHNQKLPNILTDLIQVDFINGCAMLVRKKVFESIGFLDEGFFMFAEEVDFCWRARLAGFHLGVTPRAKIFHKVSKSTNINLGKQNPLIWYLRIRNQNRFYRRYAHGFQSLIMISFGFFRALFYFLFMIFMRKHNLARVILKGWWDGVTKSEDEMLIPSEVNNWNK